MQIIKFYEELRIGAPVMSAAGYFIVNRKMLLSVSINLSEVVNLKIS